MKTAGFIFLPYIAPKSFRLRGWRLLFASLGRPMRLRSRIFWYRSYPDGTRILNLIGYQLGAFPPAHLLSRDALTTVQFMERCLRYRGSRREFHVLMAWARTHSGIDDLSLANEFQVTPQAARQWILGRHEPPKRIRRLIISSLARRAARR